jgi:hypothetical protein
LYEHLTQPHTLLNPFIQSELIYTIMLSSQIDENKESPYCPTKSELGCKCRLNTRKGKTQFEGRLNGMGVLYQLITLSYGYGVRV